MNKASLRFCILLAISVVVFFSCKKTTPLNTYPANNRLLNVTRYVTRADTLNPSVDSIQELYRFTYDNYGRVSKIYYTTNEISKANTISNLTYSGDTIFDKIEFVNTTVTENDTFITDLHGHIAKTYILGQLTTYSYYGNLLTRIDAYDGSYETLTSYNGNFTSAISSLGVGHNSNFTYITDKPNRIGDYFYLTSMFRYGYNLFQNNSLVSTIDIPGSTTTCTYVIDGDNKVTQTTAIIAFTSGGSRKDTYKIQYEKY